MLEWYEGPQTAKTHSKMTSCNASTILGWSKDADKTARLALYRAIAVCLSL